jgi:alpha-amylase
VLRAQCNDPYWHGVFGGLYLPHLRQAAYADLLSAERLLGPAAGPELEVLDLDVDGAEEVLLRSTELVAVIRPARGGALAAFDHLPSATALLDILRRRREPEHAALEELAARRRPAATPAGDAAEATDTLGPPAPTDTPLTDGPRTIHGGVRMKEPGLERLLFVDSHPRGAFIDHFFPAGTTVSSIHEGRARELGDFIDTPYAAAGRPEIPGDSPDDPPAVLLTRQGTVAGHEVHLEKTYRLESGADHGLAVTYRLTIGGAAPSTEPRGPATAPTVELRGPATAQSMELPGAGGGSPPAFVMFAPEVDLTLLAGWSAERYVMVDGAEVSHPHLADIDSHPEAQSVELVDQTRGLAFRLSWSTTTPPNGLSCLHRYGIVTVSQSEDGFERIYQGTALLPSWTIPLNEESSLRIRFRLEVLTA